MADGDSHIKDNGWMQRKPTLVPTLIVGLGGTGVGTVRAFKRRLRQAWGIPPGEEGPGIIQLLGVDTVPWTNLPGEEYLQRHEYAYIGGYNATQVLRHLENHPTVSAWWNWDARQVPLGQIHSGARQTRCVGRLSFFRRYRTFWNHLEPKLNRMASVATIEEAENQGYPVVRQGGLRHIYVVSSLCGGTGSGIFLDVAQKLRDTFQEQAIITGVFTLPSVFVDELDSDLQKSRVQANAYAALKELDYFQSGHDFEVQYPGEQALVISRPFDRIYLVDRQNRRGEVLDSIEDVMEMSGHQIFLETVSHIGSHIWAYDVNITQERSDAGQSLLAYSSFATSSLVVPQERMREYCALQYAARLLDQGLLRELTPADMNSLEGRADALTLQLDDVLHHRHAAAGGQTTPVDPGSAPQEAWDEEEEWDDSATSPSSPWEEEVDEPQAAADAAQWSPESFHRLLDELQAEIHDAARRYGLRGALFFASALHRLNTARQQASRADEEALIQRIETVENRLRQVRDPAIVNLLGFWPFDMLFVNNLKRATQQERMVLSDHLGQLQYDLRMEQAAKGVWSRLLPVFDGMEGSIEGRIGEAETARNKGITEGMRLFFRLRRQAEQETIYDLTSDAVDEAYITDEFEPDNWRRILAHRLEDSLDNLVGDPLIFQVQVTLAERRTLLESSFSETLSLRTDAGQVLGEAESRPLSWLDMHEYLMAHSRRVVDHAIPVEEFRLERILAANRAMLGERFKQLFSRCHPFWRYDLDKGGFDEQDLEHTILVGVDDDLRHVKLYDGLLRDYAEYERVSTGDPTRIDACRIEHGLPITYLEAMSDYFRHYLDFIKRGPLHLDSSWRNLPDIVLQGDLQGNGKLIVEDLTPTEIDAGDSDRFPQK
ncbi:MAG: tubulin-like doman-containing protein [Chloroflexota bacterium]|nr:tubulin-like doman-containing protein [Chloroflexota bacterium]